MGGTQASKDYRMKLAIVTIVLDGFPFLPMQLASFNRIDTKLVDWTWHISEGASMNRGSTAWCRPQSPRLSRDGTGEFLNSLRGHPRVRIYQRQRWESKDEQINEPLKFITEPCLLLQCDVDEMWTAEQLETLVGFFNAYPDINCARFFCRYFVGPNMVITSTDTYGNKKGEWFRAWRFNPGQLFRTHEPPRLLGMTEQCATREQTKECGLVFDHLAYVFEHQISFKGQFYGYPNAVAQWRRLQRAPKFPVKLRDYLHWVKDDAVADLLHR